MISTLMIIHAIISVLLILVVLLQFGKGAEAGLMSGGGGGDSVMTGPQEGNILSKATVVLVVLFLGGAIFLSKLQSERSGTSIMDSEAPIAAPLSDESEETKPEAKTEEASTDKPKEETK